MIKLTKRKGFNFFRSYYDVFNELENDKDKIAFIEALLDRQFLGIKPTDLRGLSKFAYISQTNSIDSQVKGWEDKTGLSLHTPTEGGRQGGSDTPTLQVEVEVEVEGEEKGGVESIDFNNLLELINLLTGRNFKVINSKVKASYKARLKDGYTKDDIKTAINNAVQDEYHKENNFKYLTPEFFSRPDKLDLHSSVKETKAVNNNPILNREDFFTE